MAVKDEPSPAPPRIGVGHSVGGCLGCRCFSDSCFPTVRDVVREARFETGNPRSSIEWDSQHLARSPSWELGCIVGGADSARFVLRGAEEYPTDFGTVSDRSRNAGLIHNELEVILDPLLEAFDSLGVAVG